MRRSHLILIRLNISGQKVIFICRRSDREPEFYFRGDLLEIGMFTHQSLFLESDRLILIFWNSDKNKIIVLDAETTFRFGTQLIN